MRRISVIALVISTFVNFFACHGVLSATLGAYVKQAHESGVAAGLLAMVIMMPIAGWIGKRSANEGTLALAGTEVADAEVRRT